MYDRFLNNALHDDFYHNIVEFNGCSIDIKVYFRGLGGNVPLQPAKIGTDGSMRMIDVSAKYLQPRVTLGDEMVS